MRYLNLDHLRRCIQTLQQSLRLYQQAEADSIEQEVFRNAIVKGYELTQDITFKLLKKALKAFEHGVWMANPYRFGTCPRRVAIRGFRLLMVHLPSSPSSRLCLAQ